MGYLTRDAILGAEDLEHAEVEVPEWGGTVRVRGLTGQERDAFELAVVRMRSGSAAAALENVRARLVSLCCVDEKGDRLFSDRDVAALGGKSAKALERVFDAASRLSGLGAADVRELAKNLRAARSGGSGSG